ncbi:MAG: ABC transporter ATP-binding protein [Devosiaceae bacterium]|nr:ABC transporter ATP-binding protein [Devosiaceae bacterium MH13]
MSISVTGLTKSYGSNTVLDGLDLAVEEGSFTVMCGPTGSGKSVLLRLLVGLEAPDAGSMTLNGVDITSTRAAERAVGYVPQSFALYPHLSVKANIGYPLKLAKRPSSEIAKRVDWAAGVLAITHLLDKTPDQLSGGEKQRTAVARGLLKETDIFLLDDPLVGLDYKLRERLMDELKSIQQDLKATFLYTTSDSLEALTMAEKLMVLDNGAVIQKGDVFDVYRSPAHRRAMELVGFPKANVLPVLRDGGAVQAGPFKLDSAPEGAAFVGLRPEALQITETADGLSTKAQVQLIEELGGEEVVYLQAVGHGLTMALAGDGANGTAEGDDVVVRVDPTAFVFFDGDTGNRLAADTHVKAAAQ